MNRPKLPVRRILAGIVLALAAAAGGIALWVGRVAEQRWEAFLKRHAELRDEVRKQDGRRPVLKGEPLPGNAWDDYMPVLKPGALSVPRLDDWPDFGQPFPGKKEEALQKFRSQAQPLLSRFVQGSRREIGDFPFRWEKGTDGATMGGIWENQLLVAMLIESRLLVLDGRRLEAAELLLSFLQYSRDMASHSTLSLAAHAQQWTGLILDDLRALIAGPVLRDTDLREVERQLEVLDASYPKESPLWTNELFVMGYELQKPGGGTFGGMQVPRSDLWRYGYSTRIAAADAFARADEWRRIWSNLENGAWDPNRDPRLAPLVFPRNPYFNHAQNRLYYGYGSSRSARTPLRLLRVAAHFRATGEWLPLDDPYGDKLCHQIDGNKLKAWSVGPDGKDDGGDVGSQVDWRKPRPDVRVLLQRPARDLVIEVTR